jgi:Tol biopolymer transport system component
MVSPDGKDLRRITNDPYGNAGPDFSPDGSQIAYVSTRDGNSDVFIVDTLGSEPRRITDSPSRECCPDWAPDGTRLLYVSDREERPGLYVVNIEGGNSTWLAAGSIGRWSPDRTRIAFHARTCAMLDPLARDDDERCRATGEYGIQGNLAVFLISPDGSNLKRVWPPDREIARVSSPDGHLSGLGHRPLYPVWSPDGTRLAVHAPSPAFARDPAWQGEIDRISDYFFKGTQDQLTPQDSAIWADWILIRGIHILVIDTTGVKATDVTIGLEGAGHPAWSAGAQH